MSQITAYSPVGGGGGGPLLQITPDTGSIVMPVAGNVNVFGAPSGTISTFGTGPTLLITDSGSVAATLTTTDATVHDILTIPLSVGQSVSMEVLVIGAKSDQSEGMYGQGEAAFRKSGIIPFQIFINTANQSTDSLTGNPNFGFSITAGNPVVTVQGVAATTYTWKVYCRYIITP